MTTELPAASGTALGPLLALVAAAICILVFDTRRAPWRLAAWISLAGIAVAGALMLIVLLGGQGGVVQSMLNVDGATALFTLFLCGVGSSAVLIRLGIDHPHQGSAYALLLLALSGALIAAQSMHVLPLTLGLAILHVSSSALLGTRATWRYAIHLGASLASLLLGFSLLYGAFGTLRIEALAERLARLAATPALRDPVAMLGLGLVVSGVAPLLGVIPFHTWLPGTTNRARVLGAALISMILPGAAIATLARLGGTWTGRPLAVLAVLGALSVGYGYLRALRAHRVRDAVAGVAIAQSGTLTMALGTVPTEGWSTLLYVLFGSGLHLACLWGMAVNARRQDGAPLTIDDIAGLGQRRPWLATAVTLCLLSLAGAPPLAGAMGQLRLLPSIIAHGYGWAAGLAIAGNGIAWLLLFRWAFTMWMHPLPDRAWVPTSPEVPVVVLSAAIGTFAAGVYAGVVIEWIEQLIRL